MLIKEIRELPSEFSTLIDASVIEGHSFVRRTKDDWFSRKNMFDRTGEVFFLAYDEMNLIGCCGLNVDPYMDGSKFF